jgi:flagellar M-ring protein FliF
VKALWDGLKGLGPGRLAALAAVGVFMLGLLAVLALRGGAGGGQMALLYADLDTREASQIADQLDRAHIAHQEGPQGDRVLVPATDVARARMLLAKAGLPTGGSIGYEIFDRGDGLTASQFQEHINETRALEGEIARSIRMIDGVRAARVHLVLPRREPFARESQPAQASVMLTMAGAGRLDPQAVQAVLNLVAAAVPGLTPQAIAVIDSRGRVLARGGAPTDEANAVQTEEELRRATELRLSRAVEEMLEQSLGAGHVRAEAAVQMRFDRVQETHESYDPDQQVVRSTQSVTEKNRSSEGEKNVSVQNNLPNADAGQTQSGSEQQRQEETTNYEIGKTVRTLVQQSPQIARISLAVMVDGEARPEAKGKAPAWAPRSAEELARIERLVKSAIGFDEKRGDTVTVASMRFLQEDAAPEEPKGWTSMLARADLVGLGQSAILAATVLLALLFVLRPMVMRIASAPAAQAALVGEAVAALPGGGPAALPGPDGEAQALLADESMIDVARVEGKMRASLVRRVAEMIEANPEQSIAIMRGWMAEDEGRAA